MMAKLARGIDQRVRVWAEMLEPGVKQRDTADCDTPAR